MDSLLDQVNDHEARIVKQENKTKTHDGMHKNGKCLPSLFFLLIPLFVSNSQGINR